MSTFTTYTIQVNGRMCSSLAILVRTHPQGEAFQTKSEFFTRIYMWRKAMSSDASHFLTENRPIV